ncbi:unnamed protein product [Urochloa decumbens]|uniref:KIB1-4 beta-propeller domain-containing protein n=1 Tax=Urochloa decumbens TaxID=240449 RepID=A0ABC9E5G8_9POAL
MNKEPRSSSWADLQPELLGLVLLRLPSLVDRVRLRAVCRSWRSNGRLQPLPSPLPWLTLLDGTFLSIPDGKIIRMQGVPDDAFCCGSTDSWLFFVRSNGQCSMLNPFSKARLDLPKVSIKWFEASPRFGSSFRKLVVPSPLESSPDSVAVLLGGSVYMRRPSIATELSSRYLFDIAFFNGKLYGISVGDGFSSFEINYGPDSKPKISAVKCITKPPSLWAMQPRLIMSSGKTSSYRQVEYLVECPGKLLKVMRMIESSDPESYGHLECDRTATFDVFEADLSTEPGQWRCAFNLGGQAIFLGKHCSKSLPAGECTGIQEDCIYFMCDYRNLAVDPLHDSGVYNMRTGVITPLLSETAAVPQYRGGQGRPTWIFPADAM